jgi:ABC-type branched-subunit amino acid transport system ATPase component/branched-subunit amino acid ABC-type transport system permease component
MAAIMPFIIIGIVTGAVYGLAATGLVLTYKTSGLFNFAHGAVATVAAYGFFALNVTHGVPWLAALALSVFVLGPVTGILLELMARRLAEARTIYKIVAFIGLILAVEGFFTIVYGSSGQTIPQYLPTGTAFTASGTVVSWNQVIVTIIAVAGAALLYLFLRFTRLGLAMRGVVDNVELLDLSGTSPVRVRRWSWMIGSTFASLAGVLLAPSLSLNALVLTLLIVQAFGAAALGFFSSLPLTFAGGLVVGIVASVLTKYGAVTTPNALLSGLPPSVPFLILFLVLVVTPRRRLVDRRLAARSAVQDTWRAPARVQVAGAALALAALIAVPFIVGDALMATYTVALATVVLFLSLGLLVKTSGQVSLAHVGFAAIGAVAFAHFASGFHLPWLVALLLAAAVAIPVGAVVAIPAIRLSGVFLALATLGFGIALEQMAYPLSAMFGSGGGGLAAPRPDLWVLGSDRGYYYLVLFFVVLSTIVVGLLTRGRLGRLLRGLADSPTALATHGASVNITRVLVFCISAFLAALYGGLFGGAVTSVTAASFTSFSSLTLLAVLTLAIGGAPWYAFFAAAALVIPGAYISSVNLTNWLNVIFGLSVVAIAMTGGPRPVPALRRLADRLGGRQALADDDGETTAAAAAPDTPALIPAGAGVGATTVARGGASDDAASGLSVRGLSVRYGGHLAVGDFSLSAPKGRITGLIGPNGAGKTTTFNACCGLVRATAGEITLHGKDISGFSPAARARLGLGRTFQRMELFDSMTVAENIALGREAALAGANPLRHLASAPTDRAAVDESVRAAAALCGISGLLPRSAGALSTGQRRLVELARVLAGPFDMLLLDEPSSGLNRAETERFGAVLRRVIADRDVGILLVEHDMELVMGVCAKIYVLDFGTQIFAGTPAKVMASEQVRSAYLGSAELTIPVTGEAVGT